MLDTHLEEHDSCALVAIIDKNGRPTRSTINDTIAALVTMRHRAGEIDGEADGCGIMIDIPRNLWAERLRSAKLPEELAYSEDFFVGHLFITVGKEEYSIDALKQLASKWNLDILLALPGDIDMNCLGPRGKSNAPIFWQICGKSTTNELYSLPARLFELELELEDKLPLHVASLSNSTVVYKILGSPDKLTSFYKDLTCKEVTSVAALGHSRYSTNTQPAYDKVQPFSLLGHNGEINTIKKLREQAILLNIPIQPNSSDSQDLNRTLGGLIHRGGLDILEAMEMIFPPIINEIKKMTPELQDLYMHMRQIWGPYAQGPAAIISRYQNIALFSVDALGLRPLWEIHSDTNYIFASEKVLLPAYEVVEDPRPISPGEKVAVIMRSTGTELLYYPDIQQRVLELASARIPIPNGARKYLEIGTQVSVSEAEEQPEVILESSPEEEEQEEKLLAAFGWEAEDVKLIQAMAENGKEQIGSLGYDGPLAALSKNRQNIADYFKESVAVVTNPAIDREREIEHFSTRVVVGGRPPISGYYDEMWPRLELLIPILLGGERNRATLPPKTYRAVAAKLGTMLFEDILETFHRDKHGVKVIHMVRYPGESTKDAIARMEAEAILAVADGARLIILDDVLAFRHGHKWVDPHLAVSAVDLALMRHPFPTGDQNFRRKVSLILRSGSLRNLHDIAVALGLGAGAVNPYAMFEQLHGDNKKELLVNLIQALRVGLEKVISTIGSHEIRGYGRVFSSIGLKPELVEKLGTQNYFGSDKAGVGFAELDLDSDQRTELVESDQPAKPPKTFHFFPFVWKPAWEAAQGKGPYSAYSDKVRALEQTNPISIRHLLDFKEVATNVDPQIVDTSVGEHSFPFLISSMSFGSQGEIAFRAYAEAAYRLNILCMNGEGGEIKDMLHKYPKNRGQQVASGRFGVNADLVNSSNYVEIKIGQGAKPGEGGHLPGSKVSAKVAAARNATQGVDLISPSNNHDIYSIEDLGQIIEEIKTANPNCKVAVKVPVVPGIGIIAVGIAKAGADFINLSGFDGGTGAARKHALKHVGLPAEIGVIEAHKALLQAGIRDRVEIWCDGGMKTGYDVVKMICLGANRVGFGTLAMVAIGCTICRGCQLDTCHVGIATQLETWEEAAARGVKHFVPRQFDYAVEHLCNFFQALGHEIKEITASLGAKRTQDLVGRVDLLEHTREIHSLDLSTIWQDFESYKLSLPDAQQFCPAPLRGPIRGLTEKLAREVIEHVDKGSGTFVKRGIRASANDRALGTYLAGEITRRKFEGKNGLQQALIEFEKGSVAGNGFCAFNVDGVDVRIEGGAQDGVGKAAFGGKIVVMKARNKYGKWVDGSVGKSFAYGAQRGFFIVQGNADSRAGIRLSGASVVIGGRPARISKNGHSFGALDANIKGFGFEYMTNGRAVVLGDPGPWLCSGMTGGVVYLRVDPQAGLTIDFLKSRLAKGAKVALVPVDENDEQNLRELLEAYIDELKRTEQYDEMQMVKYELENYRECFGKVVPTRLQMEQAISTE